MFVAGVPVSRVLARPTTPAEARDAIGHWLAAEPRPLGARMPKAITKTEAAKDAAGETDYYIVDLAPEGFAIVAGDDLVEPIIAFSSMGRFDATHPNPLRSLVGRDVPQRVAHARARQKGAAAKGLTPALEPGERRARDKWTGLLAPAAAALAAPSGKTATLSDLRVAPLVASRWDQETGPTGEACYNYYTPPGSPGNALNYPAGCVATAMAQIMRYTMYPIDAVGTTSYEITVDNNTQSQKLLGGNGSGGSYLWSTMPLRPDATITAAQRKAIGTVTHDAGVAINMMYAADGSGAYVFDAATQMVKAFRYANAIYGYDHNASIAPANLQIMIGPNLDAGYPVLLGIMGGQAYGHAVVCDGYGYNFSTLYHHLNMGWSGYDDTWYHLPAIDTSVVTFDTVDECVYNIFASGKGEIISGRVIDQAGRPVSGAVVTARRTGGASISTTTNAAGIYALAHVASSASYTVEVSKPELIYTPRTATTGLSASNQNASGNAWGVDFSSPKPNAAGEWRGYE